MAMDRRFHPLGPTGRKLQLKELRDHHKEINRRLTIGQRPAEIAEALGICEQTVSNVRNSPVGREHLDKLQDAADDMIGEIERFAPKCQALLKEIIEGKAEGASLALRAKYAHLHLARAGYGEVKKVASITHSLTRQDIEAIKNRARNVSSTVIDAEFEDL